MSINFISNFDSIKLKKNSLWKNSFLDKSLLPMEKRIYNFIIENKSWNKINKFKKHSCIDQCRNFYLSHTVFLSVKNEKVYLVYIK